MPPEDDTVRLSAGFLRRDEQHHKHLVKFSELSAVKQMISMLTLLGITGTGILGVGLYAADQKIDEKYATDADVQAVQQRLEQNIATLTTSVNANVAAQQQTAASVDSLTLTVLDLQISDVASDIEAMEREKVDAGREWSQREEARLYNKKQAHEDLRIQRSLLFERLLQKSRN